MNPTTGIEKLKAEIAELTAQLAEANSVIDAIREGNVDAIVVNKEGNTNIYAIESADYTYRILIERSGEGALSITDEGLIVFCNTHFAGLFGLTPAKIVGTYFHSYIDTVGKFQQIKQGLIDGPSKGEITLNFNGKRIHVYVSLTDLKPQVSAIGIVVTDLTEKKKHEEELALYQRKLELKINELNLTNANLEEFIHVVSHDIKEPVRKILVFTSHLNTMKTPGIDELANKRLNSIKSSAARINSLVDDLVRYSLGTAKVEHNPIDLNDVFAEVLDDIHIMVEESGAVITKEVELPNISASIVQIRQLFSNLLTNAIKYRKKESSPVVEIGYIVTDCVDPHFPNKKFHKISFRDNGIGMEEGELSRIFTIFQRLHMPDEYSGNGIGLAICKKIMENHLGKIEVESSVDDGSTFNLFFPFK